MNGTPAAGAGPSANGAAPAALPAGAGLERLPLPAGGALELATVAVAESAPGSAVAQHEPAQAAAMAAAWVGAAPLVEPAGRGAPQIVTVPLYDSHVVWSPARAAVVGPASRLGQLRAALAEFAAREAELRDAERRAANLLDETEADAAVACLVDERLTRRHDTAAARYREAVAVRRSLAGLSAAIHAPPIHPPTLASQLGERLRDRTRLAERHEHAVEKAELAERVAEACGQRAADLVIARRQLALEWAIVALLVAQTVLLLVDALASRGTP
ncbi:MAG: hypothetical protein ACKOCX_05275 [Planctomycetota bacterium]